MFGWYLSDQPPHICFGRRVESNYVSTAANTLLNMGRLRPGKEIVSKFFVVFSIGASEVGPVFLVMLMHLHNI